MFNSSSLYGYADSVQSDYSLDETSSQTSSLSRPNAKAIYMRRKEYAESINKQLAKFQYRVEHLFTCELDGVEVSGLQDCVERLKLLEMMGRVWGQEMSLEVDNGCMILRDNETKEKLDSISLLSVLEVTAMLDLCVFDSLLLISVCERQIVSVFMFQCDSLRADYIKRDLDRALQNSNNVNNDRGQLTTQMMKHNSNTHSPPEQRNLTHPYPPPEEWSIPDYDQTPPPTPTTIRPEPGCNRTEPMTLPPQSPVHPKPPPAPSPTPYTERERNVDILNHLINDIEQFVTLVLSAVPKVDKKKKKKKKKPKALPSDEEFKICLQKIKMAFNLLATMNGQIQSPSAPELVHCLFSILEQIVSRCADNLPACVVAPLFEPECVRFLSEEATQEEDQLWQSLGDAWNIPRTQWPEDDDEIPTFTPVFADGWEPPEITQPERKTVNRQEKQQSTKGQSFNPLQTARRSFEMPLSSMRVLYDFRARNDRELSVKKNEMVEILDMSKRWWKVRNDRSVEGFIPNNVLKSTENEDTQEVDPNPVLTKKSRPEEVKAWLEHKEFSNITVRCLGGISGGMLLGMTLEELKTVCPEEGRRVFYQLQNIKSALALAKEVSLLN